MKNLFRMRIPTMLGMVLLILGLGSTTFVLQNRTSFEGQASEDKRPQNIRITNLTDSSVTISYQTSKPLLGSISYGATESFGSRVLDERDYESGSPQQFLLHYLSLSNLQPDTTYYFSILSGESIFLDNNKPFTFRTAPKLTDAPPLLPKFSGRIAGSESNSEIILYITSDGQDYSTRIKNDGSYVVSLANLRSVDLSSYLLLSQNDSLLFTFVSPTEKAVAKVRSYQSSPLPAIVLSQTYDFTLTSSD